MQAVEALDDRLLDLLDRIDGLAGVEVDLQDALVVKLNLEVLRPAAVAAKPARLGAKRFGRRSLHASIMAVAGLLTLGGCSLGADEEPRQAVGPPAEIAALVQRLERATAAR